MSKNWQVSEKDAATTWSYQLQVYEERGALLVARVYAKTRKETNDRARMIAAAPQLRDALRVMMALIPRAADWCDNPEYPILQMGACGICPSCLAWKAATNALKACEEVSDGAE